MSKARSVTMVMWESEPEGVHMNVAIPTRGNREKLLCPDPVFAVRANVTRINSVSQLRISASGGGGPNGGHENLQRCSQVLHHSRRVICYGGGGVTGRAAAQLLELAF